MADSAPLVAALLQILRACPAPGEVVFDFEHDGWRYTLLRRPPVRDGALLSPRERQIVELVAQGRSNKEIAGALGISVPTAATHLRRIFSKLKVTSRAAMVAAVHLQR